LSFVFTGIRERLHAHYILNWTKLYVFLGKMRVMLNLSPIMKLHKQNVCVLLKNT